jgi:hypothetical protein
MKQLIISLALGLWALAGYSQTTTSTNPGLANALASQVQPAQANKPGDEKENWAAIFSGFANIVGSSGNSIVLSPTLYSLMHLTKSKVDYQKYTKEWFARNLRFSLSATPDNKNSFQIDSGGIGFKFTILNNQSATLKDYQKLNDFLNRFDAINNYLRDNGHLTDDQQLAFGKNGNYDETLLNPNLVKAVKQKFNINGTLHDAMSPDNLKNALSSELRYKPLWTIGLTENYGFQTRETNNLLASSEYSQYLKSFNNDTLYLDLTISYTWQADTMKEFTNLHRNVYGANVGGNLTFPANVPLEIKPSISFVHIDGPLYQKESTNSFKANITPRIRVNKQLWIPITISWDPRNGQIFGFLRVQYSIT